MLVESIEPISQKAHTIRRIDGNKTTLIELDAILMQVDRQVGAIGATEGDQLRKAQTPRVASRNAHRLGVDVEAEQLRRIFHATFKTLIGICQKIIEFICIEIGTTLEAPIIARKARGSVGCHHSRFKNQRSAAAGGIDEHRCLHRATGSSAFRFGATQGGSRHAIPSTPYQHASGKSFLQRSFNVFTRHTIASAMKRFTGIID